ncbi:MAG: hemolysin family protein [Bacteroidaceae bacterium]|nr:hemolysin family protein [Bacteroidaceae bacterium]
MTSIILTITILLFSSFFSGMEIAFVSSSKLRVEMDKADNNLTSRLLSVFYAHPNDFISTMLIGNNIALVIYGILMAGLIDTYIIRDYIPSQVLTLVVETLLSTLVVLVFGEFLPKTLFRMNPNGMVRAFALPTMLIYVLLWPISKFTSGLSRFLLRLVGVNIKHRGDDHCFKKADLDYLIQTNIDDVKDDEDIHEEVKIFQNALEFGNVKVRDCIVPRTEVDAVSTSAPLQQLLDRFVESGHSKIIVFDGDIDNVVGYVHSSEMFHLNPEDRWTDRIREVSIVPETMSAQKLMHEFMQEKRSIAVVVDEFGGTSGIVSLEDLVEEIFGEIQDEHDKENYICKNLGNGEYLLSARLEIEKVNEQLDLDLPESEEYLTVGGLILHKYQSFPKLNEEVKFGHFEFKILKAATTKIELVRLKVLP